MYTERTQTCLTEETGTATFELTLVLLLLLHQIGRAAR